MTETDFIRTCQQPIKPHYTIEEKAYITYMAISELINCPSDENTRLTNKLCNVLAIGYIKRQAVEKLRHKIKDKEWIKIFISLNESGELEKIKSIPGMQDFEIFFK